MTTLKLLEVKAPQNSPAWRTARIGKLTASMVAAATTKIKNGEAAARRDYRIQLVTERLTGCPAEEGYITEAMRWGLEQQVFAIAQYELLGHSVDPVGFCLHPVIQNAGASPDGIVDGVGLVEVKCPKTTTHLEYLLANEVPAKYRPQILWQLAVTGAPWCDFVSYDPRLPNGLQLFVVRCHRDQALIDQLEAEVQQFLSEVTVLIDQLKIQAS